MHIKKKCLLSLSILLAGTAVLLGAGAAHGLKNVLSIEELSIFQTGVRYMMWHAIAAICYVLYAEISSLKQLWPGWMFLIGITLFSGSLFLLVLTNITKIGIITPFGGLSFVSGWLGFFVMIVSHEETRSQTER